MVYMFNECSLKELASKDTANLMIANFIKTVINAQEFGLTELRVYENAIHNLYRIPMANGYNIDDWYENPKIDKDLKDRFKIILTSYPLISEGELNDNDLFQRSEFHFIQDNNRIDVRGLGAAFIYDTLSISLNTNLIWNTTSVKISHFLIDLNGVDQANDVTVKHFFDMASLNSYKDWLHNYQIDQLAKSQQLWIDKEILFPNLTFTEEVEAQFKTIGVSKTLFQIFDRLKVLNSYAKNWTNGNFSIDDVNSKTNLRISMESEQTMRRHGTQRKFKIPGRQTKDIFEPHIKTGNLRFHFHADNTEKKIYVGYIGKHLRIISEN